MQKAMREYGRVRGEGRRYVSDIEETQDKLNSVQNSIFTANESMDQFKLQMNWNQVRSLYWAFYHVLI